MPNSQIKTLNYPELKAAIEGTAAAFRCVMRLEPAGGPDDKVFPPTYLGGVYAIEKRRIKNANGEGEIVTCVVLDSVQSQANRLEESLLRAYEAKKLRFPLMVVDFSKQEAGSTQTDPEISSVGRITALDAPHRIADAIFRDSVLRANNQTRPFRQSEEGRSFENANIRNATALFELCPTALVFGTWDSTGSRGGLGNKFARTLVSEIIGVRAAVGVRTNSRIDPLGIEKCDLYEDLNGDWTVDLSKAKRNDKGEPIKYGPKGKDKGKPCIAFARLVEVDVYRSQSIDGSCRRTRPGSAQRSCANRREERSAPRSSDSLAQCRLKVFDRFADWFCPRSANCAVRGRTSRRTSCGVESNRTTSKSTSRQWPDLADRTRDGRVNLPSIATDAIHTGIQALGIYHAGRVWMLSQEPRKQRGEGNGMPTLRHDRVA
jgi:CRISPR-associated protein Csb1